MSSCRYVWIKTLLEEEGARILGVDEGVLRGKESVNVGGKKAGDSACSISRPIFGRSGWVLLLVRVADLVVKVRGPK